MLSIRYSTGINEQLKSKTFIQYLIKKQKTKSPDHEMLSRILHHNWCKNVFSIASDFLQFPNEAPFNLKIFSSTL